MKKKLRDGYPNKYNSILTKKVLVEHYINKKMSMEKVALKYGSSVLAVFCRLKVYNIKSRTRSECVKGKRNPFYGKKHTTKTRKIISEMAKKRTGELNPFWKGGKSFIPYPLGWTKTFREQIRYRDGYTCQRCGIPEVKCNRKLHVHHVDTNKNNLAESNLISLCNSYHKKEHLKICRKQFKK